MQLRAPELPTERTSYHVQRLAAMARRLDHLAVDPPSRESCKAALLSISVEFGQLVTENGVDAMRDWAAAFAGWLRTRADVIAAGPIGLAMATAKLRAIAATLARWGLLGIASELNDVTAELEQAMEHCRGDAQCRPRAARHHPECWREHHGCAVRLLESYLAAGQGIPPETALASAGAATPADAAPEGARSGR